MLTFEISSGSQFLVAEPGGQLYIVLGTTNEAIQLPRAGRGGDRWHAYFQTTYGLGERENVSRFIYDVLRSYVISNGARVEVRRFAAYKTSTRTVYMSGYNGRLYKIEGAENIVEYPNGEDDVFFVDDDAGRHVEPDVGQHGALLDRLTALNFQETALGGMTPNQQRMAFITWLFMLAFPDLMPTKPILLLEGTQGSGKTSAVQLVQLALMGTTRAMQLQRNKEDDFGVILLRSPIAIFDNTDSYIDWVPDAICAYTTDGLWTKRKLYTDDESLDIKPHAFIAVATKNPASFRREDVADRCVIMRLERRSTFERMKKLKEDVLADRAQLVGEYLWYVGRIVDELRAGAFDEAGFETHRMADYAAFARVVGRVIGWSAEDIDEMMLAMQSERDAFVNEDDPLVGLLQEWIKYASRAKGPNAGRAITAVGLHAELESLAQIGNIPFKHSARTIAQKIRSPHIERHFRIEKMVVGQNQLYKFWRATDPQLTVIEGGDEAVPITNE